MTSRREVEIKFPVNDVRSLERKLRAAGFRRSIRRTYEINTIYDLPGQILRRRGELLRLRRYGPDWILTHKSKGRAGRHKSRLEIETRVSDGHKMRGILLALGFSPSFCYEKFRTQWKDSVGQVVIDETPLGMIAEIEGPPRWIDQTARKLDVKPSQYMTSTYAELFFEWKRRTGSRATNMTFADMHRRTPKGAPTRDKTNR
jgi:adenylate cyclase class 2